MTDQDTAIAQLTESLPPEAAAEVVEVVDRAKQTAIAQQFQSNLGEEYKVIQSGDRWEVRHIASETLLFTSLRCLNGQWTLEPSSVLDPVIEARLQAAFDGAIASQEATQ